MKLALLATLVAIASAPPITPASGSATVPQRADLPVEQCGTLPAEGGTGGGNRKVIPAVQAAKPLKKPSLTSPLGQPTSLLKPGVYKTVPYTCLVIVPGPGADHRFVISPKGFGSSMPMAQPDLQFIPRSPAK